MKSRKREVNIFNMSVLDLLTGALGAFCFLMLALLPYSFNARASGAESPSHPAKSRSSRKKIPPKHAAKRGNVLPRFALLVLQTSNNQNKECGSLKVQSAQAPPGSPNLDYRATLVSGGAVMEYNLFALHTGRYHLVVDATPSGAGCEVILTVMRPHPQELFRPSTQPGPVEFDFQITQDDFSSNLFH